MSRNKINLIGVLLITIFFGNVLNANAQTKTYKCMIQMINYSGEGAYIVVSLINPKGGYEKTMYMLGPDKKWHKELKEWNKANNKKPALPSAITGASVTGGDRAVVQLQIEASKINSGYTLRFETAVEDLKYYVKDVEIPLTTAKLTEKTDGTGYIRFIRFSAN